MLIYVNYQPLLALNLYRCSTCVGWNFFQSLACINYLQCYLVSTHDLLIFACFQPRQM